MDEKTMTVEEAMNIVKNVFAQTRGTLADHQTFMLVVQTFETALKPLEPTSAKE